MKELEERFKCKNADMITDLITRDYMGMVIRVEGDRIYISIAKYIENACRILKIEGESCVPYQPTRSHRQFCAVSQGQESFPHCCGNAWMAGLDCEV